MTIRNTTAAIAGASGDLRDNRIASRNERYTPTAAIASMVRRDDRIENPKTFQTSAKISITPGG